MNNYKYKKSIYDIKIINNAVHAFKDICCININEKNEYYILEIFSINYDEKLLNKELENYIIGLSGRHGF